MNLNQVVVLTILAAAATIIIALSMWLAENEHPANSMILSGNDLETAAPSLVHTVKEGETLGQISTLHYGTFRRWPDILEANKDILQSPEELKPGMVLIIPPERPAFRENQ